MEGAPKKEKVPLSPEILRALALLLRVVAVEDVDEALLLLLLVLQLQLQHPLPLPLA